MSTPPDSPESSPLDSVEPHAFRRIHLLGVAGTGMGSFAGMLQALGYAVTGSDVNVYPPMSDLLRAWGIEVLTPYRPENLDAARPDLVVVGNVIRRVNPEATAMRQRGLPHLSFPAALGSLVLSRRHPVVVAGTHGKTTSSALMAHALVEAGVDPTFLVGGVLRNGDTSFRVGQGPHAVVEGDEYDTAYFDKGPKFLHYRPRTLLLTSVELDHADIYRDDAHYDAAFEKLVALVPADGTVCVSAAWPRAVRLARTGQARVVTYGTVEGASDVVSRELRLGPDGAHFTVDGHPVHLPIGGRHNVENAVGVWAAGRALGLSPAVLASGLASFRGVKRRQELRGEPGGVAVVDDFAHHPTAVAETLAAVQARFPGRPVWALFEPRSNTSRRKLHQAEYARALASAARVTVKVPEAHDQVPADEGLDAALLARTLSQGGVPARAQATVDDVLAEVLAEARAPQVLLVMSNGSFGGLVPRLLGGLAGPR